MSHHPEGRYFIPQVNANCKGAKKVNTIFTKLRDFIGLDRNNDYDDEYYEEGDSYQNLYEEQPIAPAPVEDRRSRSRLPVRSPSDSSMNAANMAMVGTEQLGRSSMKGINNVIGMPGANNNISEVVVMEPRSFEEMPQAIQALRERKSVVLNLTLMDPDQAQRAVDFIAGGTYALDGHQERIGESIFLFTPSCVQVSTQTGVVHEVLQHQARMSRPAATPPMWAEEPAQMAQ